MGEVLVELKQITKYFPGVTALDDMSLTLKKGEILGLIGENGAGKSTLIKVLTGMLKPDKGRIYKNKKEVVFRSPLDARNEGIACVYQELNIVPDASIVDNLFIGAMVKKKNGLLDKDFMRKRTREIMEMLGQDVDPDMICGNLGIGMQQMVEIGKAIQLEADVIILDEPSSSLGKKEVQNLFKTIMKLKGKGITFLFVSHKLEEVFELCDRVTVMRDSKHIVTIPSKEITSDELISYMVGRPLSNLYPKEKTKRGEEALRVSGMTHLGEYYDVNFTAYKGEVLGFSGLVGAGRTELFQGIYGMKEKNRGEVYVSGKRVNIKSPKDAIAQKIAFLTEDRKNQGLILDFSVRWNIGLAILDRLKKGLLLNTKKWMEISKESIDRLRIKVSSDEQTAGQLSGGNQQKVVIGKWVNADADVYVFDEPTKGIDVGAKIEVYNVMNELVRQNKCVIMISSELPEIIGMSDRVIVMRNGRITGEISREEKAFNQEEIMAFAWGGKNR